MNKIAFYIRLSVEDSKTDSLSIDGQRKILATNLNKYPEYNDFEVLEFIDNGHTGTNFERPAMQELLDLVRENQIACIFVKDFSRFGRDLLQTGYFLEKVFPLFRTRFIAVDDLYDSSAYEEDTGGIEVTFKYLISEYYSRDLSVKSLAARHSKMKQGKYQSTNCCYGYRKGAHGKMEPDPETAPNVKLIFDLFLQGFDSKSIVNELYNRKILTPAEYKASKGKKNHDISKSNGIWTNSQVLRTLQDERYTGTYIMGKREVVSIGSVRTKPKDESEWYKIPSHHEGIVTKEVYDEVQSNLRRFKCPKRSKYEFPLKSKVVCGICGHVMYRTYKKDHSFRCRHTFGVEDFPCNGLELREADINDTLLAVIKKQAEIVLNTSNVFDFEGFQAKSANQEIYGEQIAQLHDQKRSLYSKLFDKEISLEEYNLQKAEIDKALFPLTSSFSKLSEQTENLKRSQQATKERKKIATDVSEADSVTSELVELLIEKILVYPNEQIELVFKTNDFIG